MPSVRGVLERRERVALARAEELRAELERLQAAVAEADEARGARSPPATRRSRPWPRRPGKPSWSVRRWICRPRVLLGRG